MCMFFSSHTTMRAFILQFVGEGFHLRVSVLFYLSVPAAFLTRRPYVFFHIFSGHWCRPATIFSHVLF